MYFCCDPAAIEHLKEDPKMGAVIDQIGPIQRAVDPDLFSSVVHHIIGQQISTKAQAAIWQRMRDAFGSVNPDSVFIRWYGNKIYVSFRKAQYIMDFAGKIRSGAFDLESIWEKTDAEAIAQLTSLKGVGVWTAEMILLFCMQRPNIFSFDDLAIQRGLRMVYHHRKVNRALFEKYRRRFSPYCSVASLYLWAVAGGAIKGMKDYAPTKSGKKMPEKKKKTTVVPQQKGRQ